MLTSTKTLNDFINSTDERDRKLAAKLQTLKVFNMAGAKNMTLEAALNVYAAMGKKAQLELAIEAYMLIVEMETDIEAPLRRKLVALARQDDSGFVRQYEEMRKASITRPPDDPFLTIFEETL